MKTITIYELLGMIKDGKAPKKIKYINVIWEYDEETKDYFRYTNWLLYSMNSKGLIEREVEILEEDKKLPEKLNLKLDDWTTPSQCDIELSKKIDEIIDYLESKEKGE